MPNEPLSEDNTSCEEEVIIKQRYKKNDIIKETKNFSLNKIETEEIKKEPIKIIINNKRTIPVISNINTLFLLRRR
jgi:hypothetical protein